ncbi:hypothetical protein XENOCAPTIV_009971 [Xenoophorus captivus]|uniref:Uncharacterized protein n=1 Tax=Xenoophorus captivus TaxID=1517983 RepID=A0ABV0QZJ2_9TELE
MTGWFRDVDERASMKIACKMTTVSACCQTNRYTHQQRDRERGNRDGNKKEEHNLPCMNFCWRALTGDYMFKRSYATSFGQGFSALFLLTCRSVTCMCLFMHQQKKQGGGGG